MEKFLLKTFLALSLFTLAACSGPEPESVISGIDSNSIISGSFTTYNNSRIQGSGVLLFTEALPLFTNRSITLRATLDNAVGSSTLTVVFYSTSSAIPFNDGVSVTFSRAGASVNAQISYNGNSATVTSSKMSFYFPSDLDVVIDIHNAASQARVLIWRRNLIEYSAATADVDTSRTGDLSAPLPVQRGAGPYAGLIIANATVTEARIGLPKVQD